MRQSDQSASTPTAVQRCRELSNVDYTSFREVSNALNQHVRSVHRGVCAEIEQLVRNTAENNYESAVWYHTRKACIALESQVGFFCILVSRALHQEFFFYRALGDGVADALEITGNKPGFITEVCDGRTLYDIVQLANSFKHVDEWRGISIKGKKPTGLALKTKGWVVLQLKSVDDFDPATECGRPDDCAKLSCLDDENECAWTRNIGADYFLCLRVLLAWNVDVPEIPEFFSKVQSALEEYRRDLKNRFDQFSEKLAAKAGLGDS